MSLLRTRDSCGSWTKTPQAFMLYSGRLLLPCLATWSNRDERGIAFRSRARKAARTAVGNRMEQPSIPRSQDHIGHHFFGDRIADLHRPARDRLAFVRQFRRTERRPMDAIAARPPTYGDNVSQSKGKPQNKLPTGTLNGVADT